MSLSDTLHRYKEHVIDACHHLRSKGKPNDTVWIDPALVYDFNYRLSRNEHTASAGALVYVITKHYSLPAYDITSELLPKLKITDEIISFVEDMCETEPHDFSTEEMRELCQFKLCRLLDVIHQKLHTGYTYGEVYNEHGNSFYNLYLRLRGSLNELISLPVFDSKVCKLPVSSYKLLLLLSTLEGFTGDAYKPVDQTHDQLMDWAYKQLR